MISCKEKREESTIENTSPEQEIKISLAQWSFHKAIKAKKMDHLDFARVASEMSFEGIEYVNQFFKDKAQDTTYLSKMNSLANQYNVKQLLIMIDEEGYLGDVNVVKRDSAVINHHKWVDAAAFLGCHSIRVNAHGEGTAEEVASAAIDGLKKLCTYAAQKNINVIIENHGGFSSNGAWLTSVIKKVDMKNCGSLPDFGNFCLKKEKTKDGTVKCTEEYDRYQGVKEMMPMAKAVSAKSFDFGELGFETTIDYMKMIDIVLKSGYSGYIGVEYEGDRMPEKMGVKSTKALIERCLKSLKEMPKSE
jgi:sugar phosphate isomerase/epimerase